MPRLVARRGRGTRLGPSVRVALPAIDKPRRHHLEIHAKLFGETSPRRRNRRVVRLVVVGQALQLPCGRWFGTATRAVDWALWERCCSSTGLLHLHRRGRLRLLLRLLLRRRRWLLLLLLLQQQRRQRLLLRWRQLLVRLWRRWQRRRRWRRLLLLLLQASEPAARPGLHHGDRSGIS